MRAVLLVALLIGLVYATTPKSEAKITSLPGLDFTPSFDQYSGYISLKDTTKHIFYWFITAKTSDPTTVPTVLWLQGGPGCSGLGDGLLSEHGPFATYSPDGTKVNLGERFYTWNSEANVIYIESPCGVGFSYGDSPSDYHTNDEETAINNYLFLQGFFDVYPEFSNTDLWITGESYAGVYVTTLASQVLNNGTSPTLAANLKRGGLMLGNPVTQCDTPGYTGNSNILSMDTQIGMFYWHGMVSRRDYENWNAQGCNTPYPSNITLCYSLYTRMRKSAGAQDQPLELREKVDLTDFTVDGEPVAANNPDMLYYSYCTGNGTLDFNVATVPNCFGQVDQVRAYLNLASVQSAIHAKPNTWSECTNSITYKKTAGSVIKYLENFFEVAPTMRILYYSGDVDLATVPFTETQRCLETMKRPIVQKWRPYIINTEIAGYVEVYDTYTFATVKGSGHETPQFQPYSNFVLFKAFLNNEELPKH